MIEIIVYVAVIFASPPVYPIDNSIPLNFLSPLIFDPSVITFGKTFDQFSIDDTFT